MLSSSVKVCYSRSQQTKCVTSKGNKSKRPNLQNPPKKYYKLSMKQV